MAKRRSNFSEVEEVVLLEEVQKRHDVLFGAFSGPGMNRKRKVNAWDELASAFNSQTCQKREVNQLKKKYSNIKADAKVKLSKSKNPPTGGGPQSPVLTPAESLFLDFRGDDPSVSGIMGGLESGLGLQPELQMSEQQWVSPMTRVTMISMVDAREAAEAESSNLSALPTSVDQSMKEPEPVASTSKVERQLELFPPPAAKKTKNPRSDKLRSDLDIEVLQLEKERVLAVIDLIRLKKKQAEEKHEAKLNLIKLKAHLIEKQLNHS